ncbi:MAG: Holliday junction resolvase RuvX [Oscillospiraceae bacterium]|nr:Holliday junction resolvase RuvX [Oscillospiraceae bacterium]
MKILAVDYGDSRTGIACCDAGEMLASPVCTIFEKRRHILPEKIAALAKEHEVGEIVVGNPLNMNGTAGPRSELAHALADDIRALVDVPVVMWDERSTTVSAIGILNQTDVRGKKRKTVIDSVAAVLILENYLSYRKNSIR